MSIKIDYLINHPEHLPVLASWMFKTWGHLNPQSSLEKAEHKLTTHLNAVNMPLTFIALQNDEPVGMCSLRQNDGIKEELTPWLASLFVLPQFRGQGIGEKLVQMVIKKAHTFGYDTLYLFAFDSSLSSWYEKLGWKMIDTDSLNEHQVTVMKFTI